MHLLRVSCASERSHCGAMQDLSKRNGENIPTAVPLALACILKFAQADQSDEPGPNEIVLAFFFSSYYFLFLFIFYKLRRKAKH